MTLPPATRTRAKQAWESSLAGMTPDPEEAARLAFNTPVLLRPDVLDYLEREQNVSATEPGQLLASILRRVQHQIAEAPETYRIGGGPVEALWAKVESGDLSVAQALIAAKGLPITEALTPAYVQQLLWNLLPLAAKPATWRQARTRGELVRAAAEACDRRDEPAFRLGYCRGVVHWAHGLLISVPDNALLQEASTLGEEVLAAAEDDKQAVNGANYELAALWSDPYCAGRSSTDYGTDIQAWKRRGYTELTRVDGRDEKDYEMPATVTALTMAMAYWRAACDACPDNVPTLAGFAEASTWLAQLTEQPLPDDAADAIRHGIELAGTDPAQLAMKTRLLMLAAATKVTVEPTSALATADPDALLRQYEGRAGTMVLQETIGLSTRGLQLLTVLRREAPLFARRYDWIVRAAEASLLSNVGVNAYRSDDVPGALRALMASLGAWLQQERLEPVKETLARLADLATGADEQVAMEVVASIISVAPAIAGRLGRAADDYLARVFSGLLGALVSAGRVNSELLWTMLQFAKGLRTAMVLDRTTGISMRRDSDAAGILDRIAARPPDAPASRTAMRRQTCRR